MNLFKRECGPCKACCTAVGVHELGKPFNVPCEHESASKGCKIYGKHPPSCKGYACGWLSGLFGWEDRPDKIGAVFHPTTDDERDGKIWITCFLLRENVDETRIHRCEQLLLSFPEVLGVRYVDHDHVFNAAFPLNLKKYPYPNHGDGGTCWMYSGSDQTRLYLDAPRRIPLPVVT